MPSARQWSLLVCMSLKWYSWGSNLRTPALIAKVPMRSYQGRLCNSRHWKGEQKSETRNGVMHEINCSSTERSKNTSVFSQSYMFPKNIPKSNEFPKATETPPPPTKRMIAKVTRGVAKVGNVVYKIHMSLITLAVLGGQPSCFAG